MGVITFSIAAILSLPKQFITVYLGVALEQSEDGKSSKSDTIIKDVVLGVTTLITIGAMWYIYHKMNQAKPLVIYDRRKARQAKLAAASGAPYGSSSPSPAMLESTVSVAFTPAASNVDIPLTKYAQSQSQSQGGIHAPQPRRAPQQPGEQYSMSQYDSGNPALSSYPYPYAQGPSHPRSHPHSQSPPSDPFSDSARVHNHNYSKSQPQPQGASYQRHGPPRGYGSPPPDAWDRRGGGGGGGRRPARTPTQTQTQTPGAIRPQPSSAPHSPTQRGYPGPHSPTQRGYAAPPPPRSAPAPYGSTTNANPNPNPFSDPMPTMPNPYDRAGQGHASEASDATFYTAAGGHSRGGTGTGTEAFDPESAYDGVESVGSVEHAGMRTAPPSYTSHAL